MRKYILLNPGPVMVSDAVRNAMMQPDLCHRETEFSEILSEVRQKLLQVFDGDNDYTVVIFIGSGTSALDAALSAAVKKKALILSNGAYGERLDKIVSAYNLQKNFLNYKWGEPLNVEQVSNLLKEDLTIDTVAMVHHETSTGMLNPVGEVGKLCEEYQKTFVVDAISSLGGEKLSVRKENIDFCVSTANKCIQGLPGLSFVCVKRSKLEETKDRKRAFYLDLYSQFYHEEYLGETPYTPAVQIFFALDVALNELLEEGINKRIERYASLANVLRQDLAKLNLKLMLPLQYYSNTITSVILPQGISYISLHDKIKEEGFIIYAGQGPVSEKIFRIANMGVLTRKNAFDFSIALEKVLKGLVPDR